MGRTPKGKKIATDKACGTMTDRAIANGRDEGLTKLQFAGQLVQLNKVVIIDYLVFWSSLWPAPQQPHPPV